VRIELFAGMSYRHNSVPGTPAAAIEVAGIEAVRFAATVTERAM
jgi:hypothetical protein